ncbi:hypothetical protein BGZ91_009057 [Linnemannia elongata]|nr:hypothetical protein BGZ91_009057 [Linnemannia elongata]KAG0062462.1 hypothetical protein BGZ90_003079 [Linnemannia elongata]
MPWNTTKTRTAIIVGAVITAPIVYTAFGVIAARLVVQISCDLIRYSYKQSNTCVGDLSAMELRVPVSPKEEEERKDRLQE